MSICFVNMLTTLQGLQRYTLWQGCKLEAREVFFVARDAFHSWEIWLRGFKSSPSPVSTYVHLKLKMF